MPSFADYVAQTLAHAVPAGQYRYLLLDSAATQPSRITAELGVSNNATDVLTGQPCNWSEGASPVLIQLPAPAITVLACGRLHRALTRWRYANCLIYLESPHEPTVQAHLLRLRTDAVLPDQLNVLLRYFDTRVLTALLTALQPAQRQTLLQAAGHWAYQDRQGELCTLSPTSANEIEPAPLPFELSVEQQAALIDAAEVDTITHLLLIDGNAPLSAMTPPQQHAHLQQALQNAAQLGVLQTGELVAFCKLTLSVHPQFFEQPPWVDWLPDLRNGQLSFMTALERAAAPSPT